MVVLVIPDAHGAARQKSCSQRISYNADGRGEPEASQTLCAYLMESAIQKLPQDTESVLGIFDFGGAGPQNIDLNFARFLVSPMN